MFKSGEGVQTGCLSFLQRSICNFNQNRNNGSLIEHFAPAQRFSFEYILCIHSNLEKLSHASLVYYPTNPKQHRSNFTVKFLIVFVGNVITLTIFQLIMIGLQLMLCNTTTLLLVLQLTRTSRKESRGLVCNSNTMRTRSLPSV